MGRKEKLLYKKCIGTNMHAQAVGLDGTVISLNIAQLKLAEESEWHLRMLDQLGDGVTCVNESFGSFVTQRLANGEMTHQFVTAN